MRVIPPRERGKHCVVRQCKLKTKRSNFHPSRTPPFHFSLSLSLSFYAPLYLCFFDLSSFLNCAWKHEKRVPYRIYTGTGCWQSERPGERAVAIVLQWVTRGIAMAAGGEQTTICELTRLRTIETDPFHRAFWAWMGRIVSGFTCRTDAVNQRSSYTEWSAKISFVVFTE